MAVQKLQFKPGVNTQTTKMLGDGGGLNESQLIRFMSGLLQKIGGWLQLSGTPMFGTARALAAWEDFDSVKYLGVGSDQGISVLVAGVLYNITPIDATKNITNPFSTTIGLPDVTVHDIGHSRSAGNLIIVQTETAIGDILLQGNYYVATIIDADHYTITAANNALSTVAGGGTTSLFSTTNTLTSVQVTLVKHGLAVGVLYTVNVSTTVGGVVIFGDYVVVSVIDNDNFTITGAPAASSTTTGSENGGDVRLLYLLPAGSVDTMGNLGAYGSGNYGSGVFGTGGGGVTYTPARLWFLTNWGVDLLANYTNGSIYVWLTSGSLVNNFATIIATAPSNISAGIFIAMPQRQVVALGASPGVSTTPDQMLVRWSDIDDYTSWTATATNQAGSFRLSRGAHIVGGIQGPQQGMIWTDTGLWAMQYIGFPLVYGFNEIAEGCGLIAPKAAKTMGSAVYWMSTNGFFMFDGNSVRAIPCTVWDQIFKNYNKDQVVKIIAAPNSPFNEMWWFYPSAASNEIDSYVKMNTVDGVWDYGTLTRTAWIDQSTFGTPIGVDETGLLQQHEVGNDANGVAINSWAQTGWFKISDGLLYTFLERFIPDFIYNGGNTVKVTIYVADFPNQTPRVFGPYSCTEAINYVVVRARGRLVSFKIESTDLGSFWRLGELLYFGAPAGRR